MNIIDYNHSVNYKKNNIDVLDKNEFFSSLKLFTTNRSRIK